MKKTKIERLNPDLFIEAYGAEKREKALYTSFMFRNETGDYLELMAYDEHKTYTIIEDNFPFPRRSFTSNVPIESLEDFESDLKRMRIEIPKRIEL